MKRISCIIILSLIFLFADHAIEASAGVKANEIKDCQIDKVLKHLKLEELFIADENSVTVVAATQDETKCEFRPRQLHSCTLTVIRRMASLVEMRRITDEEDLKWWEINAFFADLISKTSFSYHVSKPRWFGSLSVTNVENSSNMFVQMYWCDVLSGRNFLPLLQEFAKDNCMQSKLSDAELVKQMRVSNFRNK